MRTKQSKANREARAAGKARQVRSSALGKLLIMLAVVAAIVFGVAIFFKVNTIEVQGNSVYSADQIIADVNTCSDKIEALTGVRPTLIRCPFGEYDDHVISAIRSIGMEPIQWDVDSLDWKGISASEITKRVTGKVTNGSIVLFHNAGEHTPEALPDILDYLLGEGYEIVPISKILLTNEETYIDHTGRQCRSAET